MPVLPGVKTPIVGQHRYGDDRGRYTERRSFVCHFLAATRGNKGRGTKHETKSNPADDGDEETRGEGGGGGGGGLMGTPLLLLPRRTEG